MLFFRIAAYPAWWIVTYFAVSLATMSVQLALWLVFAAGVLSWHFTTPALLAMAFLVSSPLLVGICLILFALAAIWQPKLFHRVVVRLLLLCAEKSPITILGALLAALSFGLAFVLRLLT
jgi:hypothetical protein